jgi:hypothetical protein
MKKLLNTSCLLFTAFVFVISFSSCKREKCSEVVELADGSTYVREYFCDTETGTYGGGTCTNCGGGNGGGTGVDPLDPTIDYTVFHEGQYDFVVADPAFVNGPHPNLNSRLILADLNQDGGIDCESGGPANHYVRIVGLVNGYQAVVVVDQNLFLGGGIYNNVSYGDVLPMAVTFSNKPYGFAGNPNSTPKVNGNYQISSGAKRYYFLLE